MLVFNGAAGLPFVSLALGLAGAAAVVAVSALLAQIRLFEPLRYFGEKSIVIYLAFFLGMAASRSVLLKYGWISDIGTISAIVTLSGCSARCSCTGPCATRRCGSCSSGRNCSGSRRKKPKKLPKLQPAH